MFSKIEKTQIKNKARDNDYFKRANDWAYDRYAALHIRVKQWRVAFMSQSVLCLLLIVSLAILIHQHTLVPLPIHINDITKTVWVENPKSYIPDNEAMVESDIVRYLRNRESYSFEDFNQRFQQVQATTAAKIFDNFKQEQDPQNESSPLSLLGKQGSRSITIHDIIFLDKEGEQTAERAIPSIPAHNLAKIDFTTETTNNHQTKSEDWVATIAWQYQGTPQDLARAWDNWNGFLVTLYKIEKRL